MASLVQSDIYGASNTDKTTKMDSMLFNSTQRYIRYKIIQQLTEKLFLLMNYLSGNNNFAPCKKTLIGIGNNNNFNRLS